MEAVSYTHLDVYKRQLYYRAKAYTKQKADKKAMEDYRELAKDTRNPYGCLLYTSRCV